MAAARKKHPKANAHKAKQAKRARRAKRVKNKKKQGPEKPKILIGTADQMLEEAADTGRFFIDAVAFRKGHWLDQNDNEAPCPVINLVKAKALYYQDMAERSPELLPDEIDVQIDFIDRAYQEGMLGDYRANYGIEMESILDTDAELLGIFFQQHVRQEQIKASEHFAANGLIVITWAEGFKKNKEGVPEELFKLGSD